MRFSAFLICIFLGCHCFSQVETRPVSLTSKVQTVERSVLTFEGTELSGESKVISEASTTKNAVLVLAPADSRSAFAFNTEFESATVVPIQDADGRKRFLLTGAPGKYLLIVDGGAGSIIRPVVIPGETDPPPIPDPPVQDFTKSPLYQVVINSYATIQDPEKEIWIESMGKNFGWVAGQIKDNEFVSINEMLQEVRRVMRGEREGDIVWPEESRMKWVGFRYDVAVTLDKLEKDGELETVEDYWFHWKAFELATEGL